MITIPTILHSEDAKLPFRATKGSAGFDLFAAEDVPLWNGKPTLVKTDISVEIPEGYEMQIRPRSGLALKHGVTVLNTPGTVDSDYRGKVGVIMIYVGTGESTRDIYAVTKGDKIAQAVICKLPEVEFVQTTEPLSETERGSGGFNSTGK